MIGTASQLSGFTRVMLKLFDFDMVAAYQPASTRLSPIKDILPRDFFQKMGSIKVSHRFLRCPLARDLFWNYW
jgi:hypothetical protein